jgi:hypothetical protein
MSPRTATLLLLLMPACALASPLGVLTLPAVGQLFGQQSNATAQKPVPQQGSTKTPTQDDKIAARVCDTAHTAADSADKNACANDLIPQGNTLTAATPQEDKRDRAE